MTSVQITPMEPEHFGVQIDEGEVGGAVKSVRVAVPSALLEELGMADVDPVTIVEETVAFLLEREPATNLLPEFALDDVPKYFPEFFEELRTRLS